MRIIDVKLYVRPEPPSTWRADAQRGFIEFAPDNISGLMTHTHGLRAHRPDELIVYEDLTPRPSFTTTLRLVTDGPLDAYGTFGAGLDPVELTRQAQQFRAQIAPMLIGVDAFDREFLWQRMWYAQRFLYTGRRNVDLIDGMLWDLAVRHARMPLYRLLGGCRESIPAYTNIGGATIDELVADGARAQSQGFVGVKDHSYRGVRQNGVMARELRHALGPDMILLHDAVECYTCDEAIRVGRILEKYDYTWIEEPLQDFDFYGLKKLSDALDLPVLAMEWIGYLAGQPFDAARFLAAGAIDIVRQRAVGITGQIKLAQLCETFGVPVHGGDPHLHLAVGNDPLFEAYMGLVPPPPADQLDCRGRLVVQNGAMSIAWSDKPVTEPDWDAAARDAVAVV
jgi:L-alanine-DL-glutamate epimerase-like enolase superfamily enzyme